MAREKGKSKKTMVMRSVNPGRPPKPAAQPTAATAKKIQAIKRAIKILMGSKMREVSLEPAEVALRANLTTAQVFATVRRYGDTMFDTAIVSVGGASREYRGGIAQGLASGSAYRPATIEVDRRGPSNSDGDGGLITNPRGTTTRVSNPRNY